MRRISLALALLGAVAAAGCGGAGGKSPAPSSGNKGVEQASFKLVVRGEGAFLDPATNTTIILPKGGVITGGGINCGAVGATLNKVCEITLPYGTNVTLTAAPNTAGWVNGWAGACNGTATTCTVSMTDTQFVGIRFAADSGSLGAHGPFAAPQIHAAEYLKLQQGVAGAYDCSAAQCHGATLGGVALAPSCAQCHGWPLAPHMTVTNSSHSSGACARCHVGDGFRNYIGADGTADNHLGGYTAAAGYAKAQALEAGTLAKDMKCNMCHNAATVLGGGSLNTIRFPSATYQTDGITVTVDPNTAICGQCHTSVRDDRNVQTVALQLQGVTDVDAQLVTANNKAVRPHYLGAATTLLGGETGVYLQFAGNIYTTRNTHGGIASCTDCHNAHTGALPPDSNLVQPENTIQNKCGPCHANEAGAAVANFLQLEEARQYGFEGDIDGNGVQESLKAEIEGLKAKLLTALRTYSTQVVGATADMCFVVDATTQLADQPYVLDTPAQPCNALAADGVTKLGNNTPYNMFTARSLKAAFNYMAIQNDLGAWAHNPRYVIEILFDSINDLNDGLTGKSFAAVPNGRRAFNGHFGAADAASPYAALVYHATIGTSDTAGAMGFTSAACYQCHGGAVGFSTYLAGMPAAIATIPAGGKVNAFQCATCHTFNGTDMKGLRSVSKVYFPPQKNGANGEVSFDAANLPVTFALCGSCHSARENKATVDAKVLSAGTFNTGLVNMHYLGAAATVMGTRAKSWYEYDGKSYTAYPVFWKSGTNGRAPGPHGSPHGAECTGCHQGKASRHSFDVDYTYCSGCHTGPYALAPKGVEFNNMKAELLAALDAYVNLPANQAAFQTGNGGATALGVCYDGNTYGYLLVRTAAGCSATAAKLDLNSMRAGYNLHWMNKDPGAWAHNEYYVMQLAYDSIVGVGGTPSFTVAATTDPTTHVPVAGDPLNRGY